MADYIYLNQNIQSSCLIEAKDIDSFFNPVTANHNGFAWDGTLYTNGVQQAGPVYASWYSEGPSDYRGILQTFPQVGIVLLSNASLTIVDGSNTSLTLWMQFLLVNNYALTDNFNQELNGWSRSSLVYSNGIISVIYSPDPGSEAGINPITDNYSANSSMVVNLDFSSDSVYVDVSVLT